MRVRSSAILALFLLCDLLLCFGSGPARSLVDEFSESNSVLEGNNATGAESNASRRSNEDSFADMIDRALEREFPENEQNEGPF
jgi:hypothetical protein